MAAGDGPRRHRDAARRRARPGEGGPVPPGARARGVRGARVGVEEALRRVDHGPAQGAGRVVRLVARALHARRGAELRGPRGLCAPRRRRAGLPRLLPRQLVPEAAHGGVRPRGRVRGGDGHALLFPVPRRAERRESIADLARGRRLFARGDDEAGDYPGGLCRRRAPGGPAVCSVRGPEGRRAALRAGCRRRRRRRSLRRWWRSRGKKLIFFFFLFLQNDPRRRRQGRGPRVRHGSPQDHPGARPGRLRGRAEAQIGNEKRDERRRDAQRQCGAAAFGPRPVRRPRENLGDSRNLRPLFEDGAARVSRPAVAARGGDC